MSPSRTSSVYEHFSEDEESFKCLILIEGEECGTVLKKVKTGGGATGNLKRHLERAHPSVYFNVIEKDFSEKEKDGLSTETLAVEKTSSSLARKTNVARCRRSSVYRHFSEDEDNFICSIAVEGKLCRTIMKKARTGSTGNLKRHLERHHRTEFIAIHEQDESSAKIPALDNGRASLSDFATHSFPDSYPDFIPEESIPAEENSITITMDTSTFEAGILQMIAYEGLPLTHFNGKIANIFQYFDSCNVN